MQPVDVLGYKIKVTLSTMLKTSAVKKEMHKPLCASIDYGGAYTDMMRFDERHLGKYVEEPQASRNH